MPLYDIEYVISMTDAQQEKLAQAFTRLHCERFQTPSVFLNVRFTDVSQQKVYRGGKLRLYNRAILRTRSGETRTKKMYADHCRDLIKAWDEIIGGVDSGSVNDTRSLRTVWVLGALTTAVEMGIQRPAVGEEMEWLRNNKPEFERLAKLGDEDMQSLLQEIETRGLFEESSPQ